MSHQLSSPQPTSVPPNPSFFGWLRQQVILFGGNIVGLISGTVALIYYSLEVLKLTTEPAENKTAAIEHQVRNVLLWSDWGHLIFILLFMWVLTRVLDINYRGRYHARKVQERVFKEMLAPGEQETLLDQAEIQIAKFKRYFLAFWASMVCLYFAFLLKHLASPGSEGTVNSIGDLIAKSAFPFFTFALNNISLWCIFLCFTILYLPAGDKDSMRSRNLMLRFSVFGLSILILSFPLVIFSESSRIVSSHGATLLNYFTYFDAVSGILNAIVVAMLIARLDSKLIGLPSRLILILYSYSAVQPLFAVFEQKDLVFLQIQALVLIAVFILKLYFFLIIYYTLQTGRMLSYVFCFPILNQMTEAIFENQFEIRVTRETRESANTFTFLITDDDQPAYATDESFATREDCSRHIGELREAARDKQSYVTREKFGTNWIEIIADDAVLCRSIDFKSALEAKDFADESVQKLPYCKFVQWMVKGA